MGVTYDKEKNVFLFNFEHDGKDDIVKLTGNGYKVEAFGDCFYYGIVNEDNKITIFSLIGRKDLMAEAF